MSGAASGVVVIIPARLGSTRFPRKMLADRTGRPLIVHVVERARAAPGVSRVVVATDAEEIVSAVRASGADAVMTSVSHPNGTSRIDEAAQALGLADEQVIVNVQGDEPEIEPEVLGAAVRALAGPSGGRERAIGTPATPMGPDDDPSNPNVVKVALRIDGVALYFSRAPIPHPREAGGPGFLRHVGVYAYRRGTLRRYVALAPTPLERTESLEQLRALEHGWEIGVEVCASAGHGIDTPEQYDAFVARWRGR